MRSISSSIVLAAALNIAAVGATEGIEPPISTEPEVLPDGNLRDPAPSATALALLIATTKKNLVPMPAGTFDMGDWGPEVNEGGLPFDGTRDSKPLHKVRLDGFSIGKFPVTYAEFDVFTAALRLPRINQDDVVQTYRKPNNPAGVSWQGAYDYCQWLGVLTHQLFSLPTEAQWEYAARSGGKRFVYPTDNGESEPGRNLPSFEQMEEAGGMVTVDSFPPNKAGIFYMSAGVHEWINDWYDPGYYSRSPLANPKGPEQGTARVLRGHFGYDLSAMTFKRWKSVPKEESGTWTKYGEKRGDAKRQIPTTKYTQTADNVFRCVLN
jgi:formylglycine-generating enzyme required for sulfatase activity